MCCWEKRLQISSKFDPLNEMGYSNPEAQHLLQHVRSSTSCRPGRPSSGRLFWTCQADTPTWVSPSVSGSAPSKRNLHSAAIASDGKMWIFGGSTYNSCAHCSIAAKILSVRILIQWTACQARARSCPIVLLSRHPQ